MNTKYQVTYYIDRMPHQYGMLFETAFGAIYTARSILDRHGLATDVMDCMTGEIVAIFEPGNTYISQELDVESTMLGLKVIK